MTSAVLDKPSTLVHAYQPYGSAKEFFHSRDREVLLAGPAGTGKSRVAMEKLNLMALLNPGMRGIIVRKTLVSLGSTALVTWRKFVIPEALQAGTVNFYGGSQQESAGYRYDNGSFIAIGGMDRPMKVMSAEYDVVYAQEATELDIDDWEALLSRLRNWVISFQQIIADCNPSHPTHWLKARADRGAINMIASTHKDNPMLFDQETGSPTVKGTAYLDILDALTGVRKLRLKSGLWAAAEGLVYEAWDPRANVVDPWKLWPKTGQPPPGWTRLWSIDWGYTNPFVLQFWARDPDGRLYLYREIYQTKTLVEDHARQVLDLVTKCRFWDVPKHEHEECEYRPWRIDFCRTVWLEPEPEVIVADHDAEDRATFEKHLGIATVAATKGKRVGIQLVESRIKPAGDGKSRLFVCRDAVVKRDLDLEGRKLPCSTEEEVGAYVWAKTLHGGEKEEPVDKDNHGMDAKRYIVAYEDGGNEPGIRFLGGRH